MYNLSTLLEGTVIELAEVASLPNGQHRRICEILDHSYTFHITHEGGTEAYGSFDPSTGSCSAFVAHGDRIIMSTGFDNLYSKVLMGTISPDEFEARLADELKVSEGYN